jgi:hypothetical protein
MSKPKFDLFKPEMFDLQEYEGLHDEAAKQANLALKDIIESCPVVFGNEIAGWVNSLETNPAPLRSHSARLAFIMPIQVEACKHEPARNIPLDHAEIDERENQYMGRLIDPSRSWCAKCGAKLTATWKAKGE